MREMCVVKAVSLIFFNGIDNRAERERVHSVRESESIDLIHEPWNRKRVLDKHQDLWKVGV